MSQVINMERPYGGVVPRSSEAVLHLTLKIKTPKTAFQRFLDILSKHGAGPDELSEKLRIDCIEVLFLVQKEEGGEEERHLQVKELIHKIRERTLRNPIDLATYEDVVIEGGVAYERRRYAELKTLWGGVSPVDGHVMEEDPKAHVLANEIIALIDDLYKECDGGAYSAYRKELSLRTSEELGLDGMYAAAYQGLLKEFELRKLLQREEQTAELLLSQKSLKRVFKDLERKEAARVRLTERIEGLQKHLACMERLIAVNRQSAIDRIAAEKKHYTELVRETERLIKAETGLTTALVEAQRSRMQSLEREHKAKIESIQKEDQLAQGQFALNIQGIRRELDEGLRFQAEAVASQRADQARLERLSIETQRMQSSNHELQLKVQENARRTQEIADDDDGFCSIM